MPPMPTRPVPPLSVETTRERLRGKTVQVGTVEELAGLDRTHYDVILDVSELIEPDAPTGPGGLKLREIFERLPDGAAVVQLSVFPAGTAPHFGNLPPGTPPPFAPGSVQGRSSTAEAQAELGGDSAIQFIDPTRDLHPDWRRYRTPDQIPDGIKLPDDPSRTLRELAEQTDPQKAWAVYYEPKKPRNSAKTLPRLDPDDPRPLDREEGFGQFSVEKTNDILSDHGEHPVNFGRYEGALKSGWEDCRPSAVPRNHPVEIEGKPAHTRDLVKGCGKGAKWAHRTGTSWTAFEPIDKKHWPSFAPAREAGASDTKVGGFIRKNPRLSILLAIAVAVLIWVLGGTLGVLVDIVIFAALAVAVLVYSVSHRGFASEAAWFGLGVGGLFCLWWWIYDHKAGEATVAAAFAHGLAWGFAVMIVAFVLALAVSKGQPIFTEENFERFRWLTVGILGAAVLLLVLLVVTHNAGVSDHGPTKVDPDWYETPSTSNK